MARALLRCWLREFWALPLIKLSALPFNLSEVHLAKGSLFASHKELQRRVSALAGQFAPMRLRHGGANLTGTIDKPKLLPVRPPSWYWGPLSGPLLYRRPWCAEATGDERVKAKADAIIELGKVQSTWSAGFFYGLFVPLRQGVVW